MSSIQGDINEINQINKEITDLRKRLVILRETKTKIEKRINEFLQEKDQPGVKYKGMAITIEEMKKRTYKNKKTKETDGIDILQKYGIDNSKKVLSEILEAMRGDIETSSIIKVRHLKK
jgi:transposase